MSINAEIPDRIESLEFTKQELVPDTSERPLEGHGVLAVQHLLGSSGALLGSLESLGAKTENIHVVGKAYSSHPLVTEKLEQSGYNVDFDAVFDFDPDIPYDLTLEENIETALTSMAKNDYDRIVVIDDGGKAINLLHGKYPEILERTTCVEQTSRGAHAIGQIDLLSPVVNVARSTAKTKYESPFIAKAMVNELLSAMDRWGSSGVFNPIDNKVLIVGYGFIGQNIAGLLDQEGFDVTIFDKDPDKRQDAQADIKDPFAVDLDEAYEESSIIIGATGTQIFEEHLPRKLKQDALLVNMGSSDTEFGAWRFRKRGTIVHQNITSSDRDFLSSSLPLPWRSLYASEFKGNDVYLANGGFPIDFSGAINPVPISEIQLTSGLLLGGVIQAARTSKNGLVNLDPTFQDKIINKLAV